MTALVLTSGRLPKHVFCLVVKGGAGQGAVWCAQGAVALAGGFDDAVRGLLGVLVCGFWSWSQSAAWCAEGAVPCLFGAAVKVLVGVQVLVAGCR